MHDMCIAAVHLLLCNSLLSALQLYKSSDSDAGKPFAFATGFARRQ